MKQRPDPQYVVIYLWNVTRLTAPAINNDRRDANERSSLSPGSWPSAGLLLSSTPVQQSAPHLEPSLRDIPTSFTLVAMETAADVLGRCKQLRIEGLCVTHTLTLTHECTYTTHTHRTHTHTRTRTRTRTRTQTHMYYKASFGPVLPRCGWNFQIPKSWPWILHQRILLRLHTSNTAPPAISHQHSPHTFRSHYTVILGNNNIYMTL